jgi:hypothetical protein
MSARERVEDVKAATVHLLRGDRIEHTEPSGAGNSDVGHRSKDVMLGTEHAWHHA